MNIDRPADVSENITYPSSFAPIVSGPVRAMTVPPAETVILTLHVVVVRHAASTPPTPRGETKSVALVIRNVREDLRSRRGPLPLV